MMLAAPSMAVFPFACTAPLQKSSPVPLLTSVNSAFFRFRSGCPRSRVQTPYSFFNRIENATHESSFILRASPSPSPFTVSEIESQSRIESVSDSEEYEPQEPLAVEGGGGGGSGGDKFGGGGGGGDRGDEGEGKDENPEQDPGKNKKMALSMSQKLTLGYAALVGLGGLMGYLKSGSTKSLISGGLSALLLYYVHSQLPTNPVFASSVGLGVSAVLLIVMGARFKNSGKVFPAGVVSLVSLIMSGGYIHGILRSSHA